MARRGSASEATDTWGEGEDHVQSYPFPIPPAVNPVRRYPLPRLPAPPTPLSPKAPSPRSGSPSLPVGVPGQDVRPGLLEPPGGRGRDRPCGRSPHRSQRADLPHWAHALVREHRRVPVDGPGNGLRVRIEQQFARIAPDPPGRVVRAAHPVAILLPRAAPSAGSNATHARPPPGITTRISSPRSPNRHNSTRSATSLNTAKFVGACCARCGRTWAGRSATT